MSSPISGLNFKPPVQPQSQSTPPGQQQPASAPSLSDTYSQVAQAALRPKKK